MHHKFFILFLLPLLKALASDSQIHIVESIPVFSNIKPFSNMSTFDAWFEIISNAQSSIHIAQMYMSLSFGRDFDPAYQGDKGMTIFNELYKAKQERNVSITIVKQASSKTFPGNETEKLVKDGIATVHEIDWGTVFGSGIIHTKMIIADEKSFYLGSANTDWRSLTQVQELGVAVFNNSVLADDLNKIWTQYFDVATTHKSSNPWPSSLNTIYNSLNPAQIKFGVEDVNVWMAVSPPQLTDFAKNGRDADEDAIVDAVNNATEFVQLQVMDYEPNTVFQEPNFFWPNLDNALRNASYRGVKVEFLHSYWSHTDSSQFQWMYSLNELNNGEAKWYVVPSMPKPYKDVPFTRVGHGKYIVTDSRAYISTSNFEAGYFLSTAGVSFSLINENLRSQVQAIFERNWNSSFSYPANYTKNITESNCMNRDQLLSY